MNNLTRLFGTTLPLVVFFVAGNANAEGTVLKQPVQTSAQAREKTPLNLARTYLGAKIESVGREYKTAINPGVLTDDPNGGLPALLSDDETIGYPLPVGKTAVIVTLPRPDLVSSVEFTSFSVQGQVDVWVSSIKLPADDKAWRQVVSAKPFSEDRPFHAKFGSVDAGYMMIEFSNAQAGRVGALGIYGELKIDDITVDVADRSIQDRPPMGEVVDYNYANLAGGGNIAYTSSARGRSEAAKMIDDVPDTRYEFAPSDPAPITIVQLDEQRPVRRISVSYDAEKPGKMEFYLLNSIPGQALDEQASAGMSSQSQWMKAAFNPGASLKNAPKIIEIDSDFFKDHKPTGIVDTEVGRRRVAFECDAIQAAFLLVRWKANDGSTAGKFCIAEINVFGNNRKEDVHVAWREPASPGEGSPRNGNLGAPNLPGTNTGGIGTGNIVPPDLPTVSEP